MKKLLVACIAALIGVVAMVGCSPISAKDDCCNKENSTVSSTEEKPDCCKEESEKDCCKNKSSESDISKSDCCKEENGDSEKPDCCKEKEKSSTSDKEISDVPDCCAGN